MISEIFLLVISKASSFQRRHYKYFSISNTDSSKKNYGVFLSISNSTRDKIHKIPIYSIYALDKEENEEKQCFAEHWYKNVIESSPFKGPLFFDN